jgi:hypothetical protein
MAGIKLKQFMGILLNGNGNGELTRIACKCTFPKIEENTPFKKAFIAYLKERIGGWRECYNGGTRWIRLDLANITSDGYESDNIALKLWGTFLFEKNPEIYHATHANQKGAPFACELKKPIKFPDISDAAETILKQDPSKYGFNFNFE